MAPHTDGSLSDETGFGGFFAAHIAEDRITEPQHNVRYQLFIIAISFSQVAIHKKVI
jgi:hypothetical protein